MAQEHNSPEMERDRDPMDEDQVVGFEEGEEFEDAEDSDEAEDSEESDDF